MIRYFNDKFHRQCFGFRVSISPTLISFMLKHERSKSLWTKRVCDGNQYGGHKLGVGAIILVCRMLIKSNENNKNGAHDGHKSIENTSDDDNSNINNERRCFLGFYPGRHPETSRKHRKRGKIIDELLDISKT